MIIKKKELDEIVDGNGELIGTNAIPTNGSDLESQANNTTDYNANVGQQPFRYDMLGRFGFTLMPFMEESVGDVDNEVINSFRKFYYEILKYYYTNPNKLKNDFRLLSKNVNSLDDVWLKFANKILQQYIDDDSNKIDENVVVEDIIISNNVDDELSNKNVIDNIKDRKLQKVAGLINKMEKKDVNKLINLLERR